jgi:glycerol-3-phosphate dehydrogenase (NAD(P)+)
VSRDNLPHPPIGVVTGTPLGEALARRLTEDGRHVVAGSSAEALQRIARAARLVLVDAAPSALAPLARALGEVLDGHHLLVHTVRGLSGDGVGAIDLLRQKTAVRRLGVVAGPLAAVDLAEGLPTATVVASRHPEVVEEFAALLSTPHLRTYRSRDPLGVELASGLSDVIALACGLSDALGFGAPTRGLMVVRAVRELGRIIGALGGEPATASGLAGLGDILARGADRNSEAYRFGAALAAGGGERTPYVEELLHTNRVARGLARRHGEELHLIEGLADLIDGKVGTRELVERLMSVPVLDD